MAQQKGVKRAMKVAKRKKKIEIRRKESNLHKLAHAHDGHDHEATEQKSD